VKNKYCTQCEKVGAFAKSAGREVPIYIGDNNYKTLTVFIYFKMKKKHNIRLHEIRNNKFEVYV
jgi:hypothetical protein